VPTVEDLSPDQRAVVQLLLRQDKSYAELAALLRTTPEAIRARASAALGALGPAIDEPDRDQLSDWILGQLGELGTEDALDLIDSSPAALQWALEVGDALRASGLEPRGELPDDPEPPEPEPVVEAPAPPPAAPDTPAPAEAIDVARDRDRTPLPGFTVTPDDAPRPSRLGGILLIGGAVLVVAAIIIVLIVRGGDDGSNDTVSVASSDTTPAQTSTAAQTQQATNTVEAQVNMTATAAGQKGIGVAQFITDGVSHGVVVTGQNLPANGANDIYALWLTGGTQGQESELLGYSPKAVGKNGRFVGTITLPDDAADFHQIVLTREPRGSTKATTPGPVILRGSLG
jgi:hypothetical protein